MLNIKQKIEIIEVLLKEIKEEMEKPALTVGNANFGTVTVVQNGIADNAGDYTNCTMSVS